MADQAPASPSVAQDWDTYWRGSGDQAANAFAGVSHPLIASFWHRFFADAQRRDQARRFIDIASGTGAVLQSAHQVLRRTSPSFTCLDTSKAAVDTLRSRFPDVTGVVANASAIPLAPSSFDVATSQFGVEYAGGEALSEMARLVVPGGQIALVMHIRDGIVFRECSQNLLAIQALQRVKFIPNALRMFKEGYKVLRGEAPNNSRADYDAAVQRMLSVYRAVDKIMDEYGDDVAGGTVLRLYQDVDRINSRMRFHDPDEVIGWLQRMDSELIAYCGRMRSMCDAAIDERTFSRIQEALREQQFDIERAEPLSASDNAERAEPLLAAEDALPIAYVLLARKHTQIGAGRLEYAKSSRPGDRRAYVQGNEHFPASSRPNTVRSDTRENGYFDVSALPAGQRTDTKVSCSFSASRSPGTRRAAEKETGFFHENAAKHGQPSTAELLHDPCYYLFDTLPTQGQTRFLVTTEERLGDANFADIRFENEASGSVNVSTQQLAAEVAQRSGSRPPTHYIFHHAFVCSTLLARCLHQIDAFFAMKEPWILRRLADIKRAHAAELPPEHWRDIYCTYSALLAKQYQSGQSLVIKATNVANNLIDDVMQYSPNRKILYLYSSVKDFMISNLKKPASTQQKMAGLLAGFLKDSDFEQRYGVIVGKAQRNFLESCALIWVCNLYSLKRALDAHEFSGLRTLDMADFLSEPKRTLAATSEHFGHKASSAERALMTSPEVMGRNAKDRSHSYSSEQKQRESLSVYAANRRDIEAVLDWILPTVEDMGLLPFMLRHKL